MQEQNVEYDVNDYYDDDKVFSFNKLECKGSESNIGECRLEYSDELCTSKAKAAVECNISTIAKSGIIRQNQLSIETNIVLQNCENYFNYFIVLTFPQIKLLQKSVTRVQKKL